MDAVRGVQATVRGMQATMRGMQATMIECKQPWVSVSNYDRVQASMRGWKQPWFHMCCSSKNANRQVVVAVISANCDSRESANIWAGKMPLFLSRKDVDVQAGNILLLEQEKFCCLNREDAIVWAGKMLLFEQERCHCKSKPAATWTNPLLLGQHPPISLIFN